MTKVKDRDLVSSVDINKMNSDFHKIMRPIQCISNFRRKGSFADVKYLNIPVVPNNYLARTIYNSCVHKNTSKYLKIL